VKLKKSIIQTVKTTLNHIYNKNNTMFSISHDFTYLLYENQIYHIKENRLLKEEDMTYEFWLTFIKENLVSSYIHEISDEQKIKSIIREVTTSFSSNMSESFNTTHTIKVERVLDRDITKKNVIEVVDEALNLLNKENLLKESELNENWFTDGLDYVGNKISSGVNWLKEKGIDKFFEGLRSALFSWGGIALTAFLSATGGLTMGVGPTLVMTVWGAMLIYDVTDAITESDTSFGKIFNIFIDIIGVVTAGNGASAVAKNVGTNTAKVAAEGAAVAASKGVATKGLSGKIIEIFAALKSSKVGQIVGNVAKWLIGKLTNLFTRLTQAAKWFKDTFGSTLLYKGMTKVKKFLETIGRGLKQIFTTTKNTARAVSTKSQRAISSSLQNTKIGATNAHQAAQGLKTAAVQGGLTASLIHALGGDNSAFGDGGEAAMAMRKQREFEKQYADLGLEQMDDSQSNMSDAEYEEWSQKERERLRSKGLIS
jgi:hypothetical protein